MVVFAVGATNALWFDLATFLLGALVVALTIRHRPVVGTPSAGLVGYFRDIVAGGRYLARHRVLAAMLALGLATSWAIAAPEAVALAYAAEAGQARYGGLLMAAPMAGAVVGLLVLGRWQPRDQNGRIITMALLMPVPLLATVFQPPLVVTGLLWFLNGALQAFMLPLQATFSLMVTPEMRGRVFGLAGALTVSATGVAFLVSGLVAQQLTAAAAVSVAAVGQPRRHHPAGRPLAPPVARPGRRRGLRLLRPGGTAGRRATSPPGAGHGPFTGWPCYFLAVRPGQGTSPRRRAVALDTGVRDVTGCAHPRASLSSPPRAACGDAGALPPARGAPRRPWPRSMRPGRCCRSRFRRDRGQRAHDRRAAGRRLRRQGLPAGHRPRPPGPHLHRPRRAPATAHLPRRRP